MVHKKTRLEMEHFREKCKAHNLSMTPQRVAIYQVVMYSNNHPSTEEVFHQVKKSFPDISVDTVYRTLSMFAEIGILQVVEGYGKPKRYDPDLKPHHHFHCRKCNQIVDFREKRFDNLKPPKIITDKFSVSDVKVILEGVCDTCLAEG